MLQKPYDILVMAGLVIMLVYAGGLFVADINSDSTINDTFFTETETLAESETGFKGVADSSAEALEGAEGASEESNEESFIVRGFKSLLSLGQSWSVMDELANDAINILGIPPLYLAIVLGMLLSAFAVVLYNWWKGD